MRRLVCLVFLLCLPLAARPDGNNYGAAEYLRQGAGARASGMGGAFAAVADDATAGYWNAAGLSQMELNEYQAAMQYAFLPNDMSTSFLSYAFLWPGIGNCSVAWMNFSVGSIETRDENANLLPPTSQSQNAFFLSYGRHAYEWVKGLSLGASLKVLYDSVADSSATGMGVDLAALWQPVLYWDHTVGINVQNLFQGLYWQGGYDPSLVNVKFGTALKFLRSDEELYFNHLICAVDLEFSEYDRFNVRTGVEYWYLRDLGVRAGYNGQEITAGASYRPENYEIDYAFHYGLAEYAGNQHRLSLMLRFGAGDNSNAHAAPSPESAAISKALEASEAIQAPNSANVEPVPEVPTEDIPADVLEVQRLGGRPAKVILNKGSEQGIRPGFQGVLLDKHGVVAGHFRIQKTDPKLSLAEVMVLSQDLEDDVKAVIKKPLEK